MRSINIIYTSKINNVFHNSASFKTLFFYFNKNICQYFLAFYIRINLIENLQICYFLKKWLIEDNKPFCLKKLVKKVCNKHIKFFSIKSPQILHFITTNTRLISYWLIFKKNNVNFISTLKPYNKFYLLLLKTNFNYINFMFVKWIIIFNFCKFLSNNSLNSIIINRNYLTNKSLSNNFKIKLFHFNWSTL